MGTFLLVIYATGLWQLKPFIFGKGKGHPAPQDKTGIYLSGFLLAS